MDAANCRYLSTFPYHRRWYSSPLQRALRTRIGLAPPHVLVPWPTFTPTYLSLCLPRRSIAPSPSFRRQLRPGNRAARFNIFEIAPRPAARLCGLSYISLLLSLPLPPLLSLSRTRTRSVGRIIGPVALLSSRTLPSLRLNRTAMRSYEQTPDRCSCQNARDRAYRREHPLCMMKTNRDVIVCTSLEALRARRSSDADSAAIDFRPSREFCEGRAALPSPDATGYLISWSAIS